MQKRLLNFVILTLIVLGVTPAAHAQSFCAYIFSDIEMRSSVIPVFTPGTSKQGPVITYLTRYGKAVRKGDQFLIQGQKQSIESWGRDSDGNDFVALMDDQGHVHNESLNIFPKRAFALRQLSLDELMTYQNELVVDRILRDYPELSRTQAQGAFDAMKKFFFAKFRAYIEGYDEGHSPYIYNELDIIDYSWHSFLLFTNHYQEFGQKYFSSFLHHKTQSYQNANGGLKASSPNGPPAAIVNRDQIVAYMRETLGEDNYYSWFIKKEFEPKSNVPQELPWSKPEIPKTGPLAGKVTDPNKPTVKYLKKSEMELLGLEDGPHKIHFFNFLHDGKKWIASLDSNALNSTSLIVQNFKLKTGEMRAHTLLKIDTKPGSAITLYEQTETGVGAAITVNSIYLSVSVVREKDAVTSRPGFLEESGAITFMVESQQQLLASNQKRNGTFIERKLILTPQETSDLLKIYIETSQKKGGQQAFNMNYKGCAATCYKLVNETLSPDRKNSNTLKQLLSKLLSFNAQWSEFIFDWNDFIDKN